MKNLNSTIMIFTIAALVGLGACGKKSDSNNDDDFNNPYGYNNNALNNNYFNNGGYYNQYDGLSYLNSLCGGYQYSHCATYVPGTYYYQGVPCYQYQMYYPNHGWYNTYIPHHGYSTNQSGWNLSLGAYFTF